MRYPASEKLKIIKLVEQSHFSARQPPPQLPGVTLVQQFNMSFRFFQGKRQLPFHRTAILGLDSWLEQEVLMVGGSVLSIGQIIQFIGNTEGAHADALQDDVQNNPAMALRRNINIRHAIVFGIAEFVYATITRNTEAQAIVSGLQPYKVAQPA